VKELSETKRCPKSPDGKHDWRPINSFLDKCAHCGETNEVFT